jgi:hypothetical protein
MYANPQKNEYDALVARVRQHFGNEDIGGLTATTSRSCANWTSSVRPNRLVNENCARSPRPGPGFITRGNGYTRPGRSSVKPRRHFQEPPPARDQRRA